MALICGVAPVAEAQSPQASRLGQEYGRLEATLVNAGRLRSDRLPPVAIDDVLKSFPDIALGREYGPRTPAWLMRWHDPIRMHVVFGPSVPKVDQVSDRRMIATYAQHLARVTDHPISLTRKKFNFLVLVVTETELRGMSGFLRRSVPELSDKAVRRIARLPKNNLCMVVTLPYADRSQGIARALAIVRAEHPPLMRRSCVEEELAQGMGLPNDTAAYPSIFNDDEEFGVLTGHDELLLRVLYDRRLKAGMRLSEVLARLPTILRVRP